MFLIKHVQYMAKVIHRRVGKDDKSGGLSLAEKRRKSEKAKVDKALIEAKTQQASPIEVAQCKDTWQP
jgi:hypothetical protein